MALKRTLGLTLAVTGSLSLLGCAGGPTRESTGQYLDSSVITAKVKTRLVKEDRAAAMDVHVDTYKDRVELSGFVNTEAAKRRAGKLARQVPGVQAVDNQLVVK
ncbi:MAG TPA: BON domain-containing protein [Gammaproteobacteria bacterium]|nr:BON domain-containing protein [Gammaproteobacteria bacterium]